MRGETAVGFKVRRMKWYHEEWFRLLMIFVLFNAVIFGLHYFVLEVL